MKIKKGQLEVIAQAFMELGDNRLPLPITEKIHYAAKAVLEALKDVAEVRDALVKPYLPEGKDGISPEDEGYAELTEKLNEMLSQEIKVDLGNPLPRSEVAKATMRPNLFGVLDELGWLK